MANPLQTSWPVRRRTTNSNAHPSSMAAMPPISRNCMRAIKQDPNSVSADWRAFFGALKDTQGRRGEVGTRRVAGSARTGRSPPMANWFPRSMATGARSRSTSTAKIQEKAAANGAAVSADVVNQATRDSVRAIMMIRAYRMRGHLHADLDPLGIAETAGGLQRAVARLLRLHRGRLRPQDLHRHVLGLEYATIREMLEILQRTYCSTLGVEFMHISDPEEKAWIQERIEGPDKGIDFTAKGKKAILAQADRGRRLRAVHRRQVQGHQALRPRWRRSR